MRRNQFRHSLSVTKEKEMKITKILGAAAVAALALMAFAGTASATTLEVNGVAQTGPVTIHATVEPETSVLLSATGGGFANTCTESTVKGTTTSPFTAETIGGPIEVLTFGHCTNEPVVVHKPGYLTITWIKETTSGTVTSDGAEVTTPSPFGNLTCKTPATGADIGTLTGKSAGSATMDINAVLNCGFFLPSAKWVGSYLVTSPEGLGVIE
jgi:hypothetical protein